MYFKSTSPVRTTENLDWMRKEILDLSFPEYNDDKLKADVAVAYCPERVLPGNVIEELAENDRIIGGMSSVCTQSAIMLPHFC